MQNKVIVVGAGIAGLTAAFRLKQQGFNVMVLEASPRVGGRMTTDRVNNLIIDKGAQFLSSKYVHIHNLLNEIGLKNELLTIKSLSGIVRDGVIREINPYKPWTITTRGLLSFPSLIKLLSGITKLSATKNLPLSNYSSWHLFDDMNTTCWAKKSFNTEILDYFFEPMMEGFYFQEPDCISRSLSMIIYNYIAQRSKIQTLAHGLGSLPETLAQNLAVSFYTPVVKIEQKNSRVLVYTKTEKFTTDYVVLATTATAAQKIYFPESEIENDLLKTKYSSTINISLLVKPKLADRDYQPNVYGILIPARERKVIASISLETNKYKRSAGEEEVINIMLDGQSGNRLLNLSEDKVLSETVSELDNYFPGIHRKVQSTFFHRWPEAEPYSSVGRSLNVHNYRTTIAPRKKIILAGDYMSTPTTEGAAESGDWAANMIRSSKI
jgi:protoporphyrinogen/coproporphyrinogen III oxidase